MEGMQRKLTTMEGEIKNLIAVWLSAVVSLCYCYSIGKIIPKGFSRLFAIFPVIFILVILPLNLHFINFLGPTTFFLVWLANFKLLLFSFDKPPLFSYPALSLPKFIAVACFPIKIQPNPPSHLTRNGRKSSPLKFIAAEFVLLVLAFLLIYHNKVNVHPDIFLFSYFIYLYFGLKLNLLVAGALAGSFIGVELEPQFHAPYLSSSLQDFWGKRWNLMVSDILRSTVYDPVRSISSRLIGKNWATVPAILATFFVSGLMHELVIYYYGRSKPKWDVLGFFLLHGLCLVVEILIKRSVKCKWRLPRILSGPMVVALLVFTGNRLLIPAMLRNEVDVKTRRELLASLEFMKDIGRKFGYLPNV